MQPSVGSPIRRGSPWSRVLKKGMGRACASRMPGATARHSCAWLWSRARPIGWRSTASAGPEVARIYHPGKIEDIELVGDTLYLAARNLGLLVYDVSTPANPVQIDSWKPAVESDVRSLAVSS